MGILFQLYLYLQQVALLASVSLISFNRKVESNITMIYGVLSISFGREGYNRVCLEASQVCRLFSNHIVISTVPEFHSFPVQEMRN